MPRIAVARRALLRLLVLGAAGFWASGPAAAHRRRPAKHRRHRRRLIVIAIDPGHGGSDPGAIGPHGEYEKNITLAVARDLARLLRRSRNFHPYMTRRGDSFVPLEKRVAHSRAHHADLFISLHADALPDTAMRGLSVYTESEKASDREAAELAKSENRDSGHRTLDGVDLSRQNREVAGVLIDLVRRQTENRSLAFAHFVVRDLGRDVTLLEKPQRSAGFVVLTAPDIPSVLVELGCLTNAKEEKLLQSPRYQRRLAAGLYGAIEDFFAAYPVA